MKLILLREVNEVSCALVSMTECDTVREKKNDMVRKRASGREQEIQEHLGFMNSVREIIALYHMKTEYIGI